MKNILMSHLYLFADKLYFSNLPHSLTKKDLHSLDVLRWCVSSENFRLQNKHISSYEDFVNTATQLISLQKEKRATDKAVHDDLRQIKNLIGLRQSGLRKQKTYTYNELYKLARRLDRTIDSKNPEELITNLRTILDCRQDVRVEDSSEGYLRVSYMETRDETLRRLQSKDEEEALAYFGKMRTLEGLLDNYKDIFHTKEDILCNGKQVQTGQQVIRLIPTKLYTYLNTLFGGELVTHVDGSIIQITSTYDKIGSTYISPCTDQEWLNVGFVEE